MVVKILNQRRTARYLGDMSGIDEKGLLESTVSEGDNRKLWGTQLLGQQIQQEIIFNI